MTDTDAEARATELFAAPFADLLYEAQTVHRAHWASDIMQLSHLVSIKTGGCPEDCKYCGQSAAYETGTEATKLMATAEVLTAARAAKEAGASRLCMGAAWRDLKDRDLDAVCEIVGEVKAMGLETCATLGMLTKPQARALKEAGLDYYNHNIDTSEAHYSEIITTRSFADRIETLAVARDAKLKLCCGGIVGMGEARADRVGMLAVLADLDPPPESVPINMLVPIAGTPLADATGIDIFELVRTIAVARILMPKSHVRLSAGRAEMSEEAQALCFLAGANSVFYGEKLLTADNRDQEKDLALMAKLGLRAEGAATADDPR